MSEGYLGVLPLMTHNEAMNIQVMRLYIDYKAIRKDFLGRTDESVFSLIILITATLKSPLFY